MSGYKVRKWDSLFFYGQNISGEFQDLIREKFENRLTQTEKLHASNLTISLKLNDGQRAICTSIDNCLVVLEILENHQYDRSKEVKSSSYEEISSYINSHKDDIIYRSDCSPITILESDDRMIALDKTQGKIVADYNESLQNGPQTFIVKGMAGSGKTTIAQILSEQEKDSGKKILYTTKSDRLLNYIKQQHVKNSTESEDNNGDLNFLTYQDLWQDSIEKDNFEADDTKTKENLKDYLSSKLYDVNKFSNWITQKSNWKKVKSKKLTISKSSADLHKLYEDMVKVAAGWKLTKKNSFSNFNTEDVSKIFQNYQDFLKKNKLFDLSIARREVVSTNTAATEEPQNRSEEKYDLILVDESQDLSKQQLEHIYSLLSENGKIYYLMDGNQNLVDTFNLTPQYVYQIAPNVKEYSLNIAYRTPKNVTKLANKIIELKAHAIGGKLNKHDQQSSLSAASTYEQPSEDDSLKSNVEEDGSVEWMDIQNAEKLAQLKAEAASSIECVIIIADESCRTNAEKEFPKGMIFTAEQIKGEEFAKILLFNFFSGKYEGNNFYEAGDCYDVSKPMPSYYPKDLTNAHYAISFNKLFVGITRSTKSVIFVETGKPQKSNKDAKALYQAILAGQLQGTSIQLEASSLEDIMKQIIDFHEKWEIDLLLGHVKKATYLMDQDATTNSSTAIRHSEYLEHLNYFKMILADRAISPEDQILQDIEVLLVRFTPKEIKVTTNSLSASPALKEMPKEDRKSDLKQEEINDQLLKAVGDVLGGCANINQVNKCIKKGGDVNICYKEWNTPILVMAARNGHKELVKLLINNNSNIDIQDKSGTTPIFIAALHGHEEVVKLLLNNKANVNTPNQGGSAPLLIAVEHSHKEIAKLLLKHGGNINTQNHDGLTPLLLAIHNDDKEFVKFLIKEGANIDTLTTDNNTFKTWDEYSKVIVAILTASILAKDLATGENNFSKTGKTISDVDFNFMKPRLKYFINQKVGSDAINNNINSNNYLNESQKANLITHNNDWNKFLAEQQEKLNNQLIQAATNNDLDTVKLLIEKGADVNTKNKDGYTPPGIALVEENLDMLNILIDAGANIDENCFTQAYEINIFSSEIEEDVLKILESSILAKELFTGEDDLLKPDCKTRNPDNLDYELVKEKLKKFTNKEKCTSNDRIKTKDFINQNIKNYFSKYLSPENKTKLIECNNELFDKTQKNLNDNLKKAAINAIKATTNNNLDRVKSFIEKGADVNTQNHNGSTLLYLSAYSNHKELVKLLIESGADVNTQDEIGISPLYIAVHNGYIKIAKLLIEASADINLQDDNGVAPLYNAALLGNEELVKLLIDAGANINTSNKNGLSPLYIAVHNGYDQIVKLLIDAGSDINTLNNNGISLLCIATYNSHEEIIKLLIDTGADVNRPNNNGTSPLYVAAQNGHYKVIKLLVNAGADVNIQDEHGISPLYIAAHNGHEEVAKLLIDAGAREFVDDNKLKHYNSGPFTSNSNEETRDTEQLLAGEELDTNTEQLLAGDGSDTNTEQLLAGDGSDTNTEQLLAGDRSDTNTY